VRQQPEQAIEAPMAIGARSCRVRTDEAAVALVAARRQGGDLADVGDDPGEHG
jgi:hypothetical protein